jgi:hypothetical protein
VLFFWAAVGLHTSFRGIRLADFTLCRGFLRFLCAGKFVASTARFFHVAAFFQPVEDAREEAPAVMFQLHAVSDLPDAGRLGKRGEVGEDKFRGNTGRARFFLRIVGVALVRNAHEVSIGSRISRRARKVAD